MLHNKLAEVRHKQGRLLGRMEELGFDLRQEASLSILTKEVVKSAAIEGEYLNPEEVRSSLARYLGIDIGELIPVSRYVEGMVELMLDAIQRFSAPLTKKRLFAWRALLFPTGYIGMHRMAVGEWRTAESGPMQVVSGPIGRRKIHFEAPSVDRLEQEMRMFLTWFKRWDKLDPVLKSGIAHLWFVTIHPFEDGNGRIARAIGDMALAGADGTSDRFYSLSSQIESERLDYYVQLERQQRHTPDITAWLAWFLDCLGRAITNADATLESVLFKAKLWKKVDQHTLNKRQYLIINRMLRSDFQGHMNTSKYAKLAKCSNDTALRDVQNLRERGILLQNSGGGRSTSYRLIDFAPKNGTLCSAVAND